MITPLLITCMVVVTHGCLRAGIGSDSGQTSVSDTGGSSEPNGGGVSETATTVRPIDNTNEESGGSTDETGLPGCPTIISRSQWGAREGKNKVTVQSTPVYAVIHHGAGSRCFTEEKCKETVRGYQNLHMDTNKWADIGYNFIVGEDGNVYEGRGWGTRGAHAGTKDLNEKSIGICVIGDFSTTVPDSIAQEAVKQLITCAEANGKLASTYSIRAHRDLKSTACPGQRFYDLIRTWTRYSNGGSDYTESNAGSGSSVDNSLVQLDTCPTIISRAEWGARSPRSRTKMRSTPEYVVIHHGASARCDTKTTCTSTVQSYQNLHIDTRGWSDIGYNFIVGEDGNVYEGRGWGVVGSHAGKTGYNGKSLGICVIGNFMNDVPNLAAQTAIKQLISCSVLNNKLSKTYTLRGHRDLKSTECPGSSFYTLLKTWSRY